MKHWVPLITLSVLLAALALTVRAWLQPMLEFLGASMDVVQGLQTGVQLVLWFGVAAVVVISYLRGKPKLPLQSDASSLESTKRQPHRPPSVTQEATGNAVQVGGSQEIGGDVVVNPLIGAQITAPGSTLILPSLLPTEGTLETAVRWTERNTRAVEYFLESCQDCPKDEDRLLETLERWSLVHRSSKGTCLSLDGAALFGPTDHLPSGINTDVQIDDRRMNRLTVRNLDGPCLMELIRIASDYLSELWQEEWDDPSSRDDRGRPARAMAYPKAALFEALVNFAIHRDLTRNDLAYIVITDDYVQFTNPGASPFSVEVLLSASEALHPQYHRNATIIRVMSRTGLNQRQGRGIIRIREALDQNNSRSPDGRLGLELVNDVEADRFTITMYRRPRVFDPGKVTLQEYRQFLLDRHSYLGLKGMGVHDRTMPHLPLLDIYIPLRARQELPEGETWYRNIEIAGRRPVAGEGLTARMSEPVPVIDLLQSHDGLIVLGDPGAGKTTFLKFLTLRLAAGLGADLGLGERLPVLVPLSAYANALGNRDMPLDAFIAQYFQDIGATPSMVQLLSVAFDAGRALVMLDGLDEVKDLSLRHVVAERVTDFYTFRRRKGNKFVVTSRVVGYRDVRPTAEGLAECTLVDFDEDDIVAFVERWTATLEGRAQKDAEAAAADTGLERDELLEAIQRNPGVRRLATNPLLLTILALMKRQGVTLPERRVELYDQYITALLSTWNRARGLGRPPSPDLDVVQTVRVLAPLALWMHEVSPGVGLVKREELRRRLAAIYTQSGEVAPDQAANAFLEDLREHVGLLLERGPGEYGFIHLTFEEYLAAVAIALEGQGDCRSIADRLAEHIADPAWREVALLTVGYVGIQQQLDHVAGDVVEILAMEQPGPPGEAALVAGDAVLDAWPGGVPLTTKNKTIEALVRTMQAATVPPPLRRRAGLLLGRMDWLPLDLDHFVEVPVGEFLYGDDKQRRTIPYRYWIGKYPVTNAQFARFMADSGYERPELWSEVGWTWRVGNYNATMDSEKETRWLALRPAALRDRPFFWDDRDWSNPLFPVVGVTWFEAEAYANWLNRGVHGLQIDKVPSSYIAQLPTEEEWERAARGSDAREYPWGQQYDSIMANVIGIKGEGIGTTAVSTYPQGASPPGAWDMSGNVWEWTCSSWSQDNPARVMRGGSWMHGPLFAQCSFRAGDVATYYFANLGFRVAVSPPNRCQWK